MALLDMIIACFRKTKSEKSTMLTKSMECLIQAETVEQALLKGTFFDVNY
jgi:hypothetical protein